MATHIFNVIGDWPSDANQSTVKEVLSSAAADESIRLPEGVINVKLVDDAAITALNKQYTGNAYATDVLSFSYGKNPNTGNEQELGDIAISIETARNQAAQAETDITTELALLALHGLLHIAGYDHATRSDQERMDQIQKTILGQHKLTYREFGWQKDA